MFEAGRDGEYREASAIFVSTAGAAPRSRAVSFLLSVTLHIVGITAAVNLDSYLGPPKSFQVRLPEQVLAESENRVLFYPLQRDLPEVAPVKPATPAAPDARARFRMPQTIVANDPNPDSGRQMILGPSPAIKIEQDIPSPNLLAWSAPRVSPLRFQMSEAARQQPQQQSLRESAPAIEAANTLPDAPNQPEIRLRYRAAEPEQAVPQQESLASESAPRVSAGAAAGLDVAQFQKLDPLRYRLREQARQDPGRATLPDAVPQVAAAGPAGLDPSAFSTTARLRYWMPEGQTATGPARGTLSENAAPELTAKLPAGASLGAGEPQIRLRYRGVENLAGGDAAAPAARSLGAESGSTPGIENRGAPAGTEWVAAEAVRSLARVEAPRTPSTAGDGQGSSGRPGGLSAGGDQPNFAVVGVDPDPNAPTGIPEGQRRGRFAASPDGGPGGGDQIAGPTETASVRMPNLSIAGPAAPPVAAAVRSIPGAAAALSRRDPGGADLLANLRSPRDYARMPIPPPGAAVPEPDQEDQILQNKAVYTLAVNMPNITSASGSWVIRYAELGTKEREDAIAAGRKNVKPPGTEPVSAPSPRLKVDPKYIRSAADEGIEGKVVLYAVIGHDGLVREVRVMRGLDARLDDSAVEAFSKWKFDPATSAGLPVDVEAVVEIPFQLAPLEPTPKKFRY